MSHVVLNFQYDVAWIKLFFFFVFFFLLLLLFFFNFAILQSSSFSI